AEGGLRRTKKQEHLKQLVIKGPGINLVFFKKVLQSFRSDKVVKQRDGYPSRFHYVSFCKKDANWNPRFSHPPVHFRQFAIAGAPIRCTLQFPFLNSRLNPLKFFGSHLAWEGGVNW